MNLKEMTVGERIRFFREGRHLTQNELAEKVGTSPQNIYKYEQDIITNIPITRIACIAKVLDVPPARIAGWDYEVTVNPLPDLFTRKFNQLNQEEKRQVESYMDYILSLKEQKKNSLSVDA